MMGADIRKRKLDHNTNRRIVIAWQLMYLSVAFILGYVLSYIQSHYYYNTSTSTRHSLSDCSISIGASKYKGAQYTTKATLGAPKCLVESKILKVQQHRVRLEGTADVIEDWLWIDYHDRINVLIEAPESDTESTKRNSREPHLIILQQTKYALEGQASLAIVGGIIEPGEAPDNAAKREVLEESGHKCDQLHFLGRYRTDVNRGMGWTHTYLATSCTHQQAKNHDSAVVDEVGKADTEKQTLMTMSLTDVREAVMAGKFLEIQWSATVALAMLFYDEHEAQ